MNTSQYIRHQRYILGLTQKQLAEATGYSKQCITDYELQRTRPPGDLVLKIQALVAAQEERETTDAA